VTQHTIEITVPRASMPDALTASCSCGWRGPLRTGRNARVLARGDERDHQNRIDAKEST
jgi:hypothetical protein